MFLPIFTQCKAGEGKFFKNFSFSLKQVKSNPGVMIEEKKDYVTKSKLTITVKTLSKYNDQNRVAAK